MSMARRTSGFRINQAQTLPVRAFSAEIRVMPRSMPITSGFVHPFTGWKASGYGAPEHGRWNRDFYTRVQAVYGH